MNLNRRLFFVEANFRRQMSKIYGLLGRNISYSLSPVMHNTAFAHFGITGEYRLFDKPEEEIETFFDFVVSRSVEYGDYGGMNVTVPYKVRVKDLVAACRSHKVFIPDEVDMIGALNTIKFDKGKIYAHNTDVRGFYLSVKEDLVFDFKGKKIIVCGAGGAGRAISLYLAALENEKVSEIIVLDVDPVKMKDLENSAVKYRLGNIRTLSPKDLGAEEISSCDLVVNATPLGTKEGDPSPVNVKGAGKKTSVYDLVYARKTELAVQAEECGMKFADGLGMLVNQAALSFEIWTGTPFKEVKEVMKKAIKEKLGRA